MAGIFKNVCLRSTNPNTLYWVTIHPIVKGILPIFWSETDRIAAVRAIVMFPVRVEVRPFRHPTYDSLWRTMNVFSKHMSGL